MSSAFNLPTQDLSQYIHQLQAIIILDSSGKKLHSKYYPTKSNQTTFDTPAKREAFEKKLWEKTTKVNALSDPDICVVDSYIAVYAVETDVIIYLIANMNENEVILSEVLLTITDAMNLIFRNQLEKRTLLENFDLILLIIDEVIDDGVIMEIDSLNVAKRVDRTEGLGLSEESDPLAQVMKNAREQLSGFTSSFFSF